MPFLRFVSKTGKQKDRQPPWKGGESGAACLYGELLNICGCQEGFGSLSAASGYCLAWVGDSILKGPRLRRSFLPAFAGFLGGALSEWSSLTAPLLYRIKMEFLCGDFEQIANKK